MDAIKKKMQAMKLEKDNAMDKADTLEQQNKEANLRAEKTEEEIRATQKKMQQVENELDQAQEQLSAANTKLDEKEKALQNAEGEVAALNRRIQLLEEDLERSEERLNTATTKLAEASQAADESERMRKVLENRSLSDEERMDALENQLKEARFLAEEADRKYDEVARKLAMVEADLERAEERAESGESKIVELEEELRVVGNNLKSLEVSEEKANQREETYKEQIKTLANKLKAAEARAEFAERSVQKLQKEVDRLEVPPDDTMTTAAVSLPPPRRKTRVKGAPGTALPLPSALPHPPCTHYQATYSLGHITISDPRQAEALWHNGYYGHGMEGGLSGRPKAQKKWRLVEADGLKSGKWFKETHEAGRHRRGKGEILEKEEEREEKMEIGNTDEEKKKEEGTRKENEVGKKIQNMEEHDELNMGNNDKSVKEEEKEDEEAERSMKENKEDMEMENKNNITTEHHEDRGGDFTKNKREEMEIQSDSDDSEPWKTVLVLSGDQQAGTDTNNPHTYLTLLPEEALFLSYALGCLVLTYTESPTSRRPGKRPLEEHDSHEMTIDEMWRVFCQDDPTFPVKYAAYHHFRSQGWVVKAGLKYGVDYVLYPVGPPFYHSQYAVKIHSVWADTLTLDHSLPGHAMTWTTIATTERLSNHINKTPVICLVLRPRSLTHFHLSRIECLKELKVQEMVLGRWNALDGSG